MLLMHTYPKIPNVNVPSDASLAATLGLGDLRVGRHYLRDESRSRVGCIWLDTLWLLHVRPSFDHHGLVGVVTSHGEDFRGGTSPGWTKAILASNDSFIVQEVESDPLPPLLAQLPLLRTSNSAFLDGVGYELRIQTTQLTGKLSFRNPTLPELVAVERQCWELADTVARASGDKSLAAFTATWRRYQDRSA
jgi:hypothetical protein